MKKAFFLFTVAMLTRLYAETPMGTGSTRLAMKVTYDLIHPLHRVKGVSTNGTFLASFDPGGNLLALSARIPVADFNSGNENRDSHALEVVEALRFPEVAFESTGISKVTDGYRVVGNLRFHGISKEVEVQLRRPSGGGSNHTGSFQVLLSDYGVPRPALLFFQTEDRLTLHVEGSLKPVP